MENRKASDNVMALKLAIDTLKASGTPAAIIFLNFEKAYD
jgi:hypothetical protein